MDTPTSQTSHGPRYNYHLITFEYGDRLRTNDKKLPAIYDIILSITELFETRVNLIIYTDVMEIPDTADNIFKTSGEKMAVSRCRMMFTNACKKVYASGNSTLQVVRGSFASFKIKYKEINANNLLNIVQFSGHHMEQYTYLWPVYLQTGGNIEMVASEKLLEVLSVSPKLLFINDCCHGPTYSTKYIITEYSGKMAYTKFFETSIKDIQINHKHSVVVINLIENGNLKSNLFSNVLYKLRDVIIEMFSTSQVLTEKNLIRLYKHLSSSDSGLKLIPVFYLSDKLYLDLNNK